MFDKTIVKILGNSPFNTPIKSIRCDVQDYQSTQENNGFKWKCNKLMFVNSNINKKLINENEYISINDRIFRIIKVDNFNHLEVYLSEMNYINITLNDNEIKACFYEVTDKISYFDEKIMISNYKLNTGDIIKYLNYNWFITSMVETDNELYRCRITKVEQLFKMYVDSKLQEIPCIIEVKGGQQIQEGQYINIAVGTVKLTIQDNPITSKITYQNRLIKMGSAWEVEAFTSEHKGLRYLYLKKDQFNDYDNIELEIADYYKYNKKISITCKDMNINLNTTEKLDFKVFENNVYNPSLIPEFKSLDTSIATVDDKGNVTGLKEGNCKIQLTYKKYSITTNVKVTNSIEIEGSEYIKWGRQSRYIINTDIEKWTIENKDKSITKLLAKIIKQDNNSCIVEANDDMKNGYVILKAINKDKEFTKEIRIKSLFV